ncbi:MAG: Ribosomal large subunit methyltransferase [Bacteroidota bacterium]|jgi:23S rRNA (cytosine1962-C5)-methyltransferase
MLLLNPTHFEQYELLDCGNFYKLEKFGSIITIRPEPQAVWKPAWSDSQWNSKAHLFFKAKTSASGEWQKIKPVSDRWQIDYTIKAIDQKISLRLALTAFKHVGIFPEQAVNWEYIANSVLQLKKKVNHPKVLNLFAYTGGSSLAAKAAGADVTHLDSVKQVVSWANDNRQLSHLSDIRWVVEDALVFAKREAKRGNKYHGIILDPPAYGHGTKGEKWKLEDMINEMVETVIQLLEPSSFLLLNTYSLGFSALIIKNLFGNQKKLETGELYLQAQSGLQLPLGVFGRFIQGV